MYLIEQANLEIELSTIYVYAGETDVRENMEQELMAYSQTPLR